MRTRHVLPDGTAVVLRPIAAGDKEELQRGLHRLSAEAVHKRFLAPKPRFTAAELRYLTEVDGKDHAALVAELDDESGTIVAVARYVRLDDQPETAEAAIVVADFLQRQGLGTAMAESLAASAVGHGIRRFTATTLGENVAAHRLMAKLTDQLERRQVDAGTADLGSEIVA
jgi:RimJ/RimL family protein N-acetyltransferase